MGVVKKKDNKNEIEIVQELKTNIEKNQNQESLNKMES